MATILHKNIADADLHEPKGVSTATSKQVYVANGAGSGTWKSFFESAELSASVSSHSSASHGLGAIPARFTAVIRCKTNDGTYIVGDEILYTSVNTLTVWANATDIGYVLSPSTITILDKAGAGLGTIATASWKVVLRAWAY